MADVRINFYARRADTLLETLQSESGTSIEAIFPHLQMGRERWLVPAYVRLKALGIDVRLSSDFDEDAINVAHNDDLPFCRAPWRVFLVSVRADRDPAFVTHMDICQNNSSVWNSRNLFIPYWPQPGLVPRNPARGDSIKTVAYFGKADNLAQSFKDASFADRLTTLGIQFRISERQWHDYSDVDLVLSIRDGALEYLSSKPASKLVNSWLAGCPAILNPEHGYLELRRSEADFLTAAKADEAVDHIRRLASRPDLYRAMITNGQQRARAFTVEAITSIWSAALQGPIKDAFVDWKTWSPARRCAWYALGRARRLAWGWQVIQQPPGPAKAALRTLRRAIVLPKSTKLPVRRYGTSGDAPLTGQAGPFDGVASQ